MDRSNHYEAALEAYLQWHRVCYVAVDETKRAALGETDLKSLDFIVFGANGPGYLVDVKGRQFPAGPSGRPRRVWECWSTHEDISGLRRWADRFGPGYEGLLVFAYQILPEVDLWDGSEDIWEWHGRRYSFRAVRVSEYRPHMRVRSPRWGTVDLPSPVFRGLVRPFHEFLDLTQSAECPF
jgi:hypothetical protein